MPREIEYTHTVLAPNKYSDDIEGNPYFDINLLSQDTLELNLEIDDKYLEALINQKKAKYLIKFENNRSLFRDIREKYQSKFEINMEDWPAGVYWCEITVCLNDDLKYNNPKTKPEYSRTFELSKGDVLAYFGRKKDFKCII